MKEGQDAIYYLTGADEGGGGALAAAGGVRRQGIRGPAVLGYRRRVWLERAPRFTDKP